MEHREINVDEITAHTHSLPKKRHKHPYTTQIDKEEHRKWVITKLYNDICNDGLWEELDIK